MMPVKCTGSRKVTAMRCDRCGTMGVVYRQVNGNGNVVIVERCPKCKTNTLPGRPFLSKGDFENIGALPLWEDFTENSEPCAVKGCRNLGSEYHHFAPRHLFGFECEGWPGAYLCKYHHDLWHKQTLTGSYITRRKRVKGKSNGNHP